jgi:hypothetical protein
VFDVKIDQPGLYPFVSHSFASVQMGQVGLLEVGHAAGTMPLTASAPPGRPEVERRLLE